MSSKRLLLMMKINIAIDGHSACGKSTTAKAIAKELGYTYIDSGAMYRAVTLYFSDNNIALSNPREVNRALDNISIEFHSNDSGMSDVYLNGQFVEDEIRTMRITEKVSEVSALSPVRESLVKQQRKLARRKGMVMDGRDIGSVVLPDAELKLFMTADINIRTERRQQELLKKGYLVNFDEVKSNLLKRDELDSSRENSPLIQPDDAIMIDTSFLTEEEQLEEGLMLVSRKLVENLN